MVWSREDRLNLDIIVGGLHCCKFNFWTVCTKGGLAGRFNCTPASQAQPPSVILFQKRSCIVNIGG